MSELQRHQHCAEGACESCDCCAAGWCINFEDGDPWADSLAFFECITPRPERGSPTWLSHREAFDLWCEIAVESRGFELRPTSPERDRAAEVEAAEDRAEQAAFDAARERS